MAEFADHIVLVTGAAGALGQAVVEEFVRVGATPVQLDIVEPDNDHYSVKCDLADAAACEAAVRDIVAKYQRIDVLANIAGGFTMGEQVHETTAATWDFMLNLNVSKNNFLGLGYVMSAAANVSSQRQQWQLQLFDPYFLDSRWTFKVDGYSITQQFIEDQYQRGGGR